MLIEESIQAVQQAMISENFMRPLHESWCFSNIPNTLRKLLFNEATSTTLPLNCVANPHPKKIVFILIDAFGWRMLNDNIKAHPFINRFITGSNGKANKITAQFPSTTVVHTLTMATGLSVAQTGIPEWFYFEPNVGEVICPLKYCLAGDKQARTLLKTNTKLHDIFPTQSLSAEFKQKGVESYIYQSHHYTPSPVTDAVMRDANLVPYKSLSQGIFHLKNKLLNNINKPEFHYLYIDSVDSIGHEHGASSAQMMVELTKVLNTLEQELLKPIENSISNTLFMVTADHGQTDTCLNKVLYINKAWPDISKYLKTTKSGKPIVPAGGPGRTLFLHVHQQHQQLVFEKLKNIISPLGEIFWIHDLLAQGFFGAGPLRPGLHERLGDMVIISYAGEGIWWFEKDVHEVVTKGNHGGLTPEEMEIPFFTLSFN